MVIGWPVTHVSAEAEAKVCPLEYFDCQWLLQFCVLGLGFDVVWKNEITHFDSFSANQSATVHL